MKTALAICFFAISFAGPTHIVAASRENTPPHQSLKHTLLTCAALIGGRTATRNFLIRHGVIANLPDSLPMGYAVNHRYSSPSGGQTIFSAVPMPGRKAPGRMVNFTEFGTRTPLPKRFVIGDGQNHRALIGVDLSPNSPLSQQIRRIRTIIQWTRATATEDELIELISQNNANQLGPVIRTEEERRSNVPALPWDRPAKVAQATAIDFTMWPMDHEPIPARFRLPIIPLEEMILRGESYCLGQALLAWILLRELKIPSRLLLGANATAADRYTGHTSVELSDGRIVDPAGWIVIPKGSFDDPRVEGINSSPPWRFMKGFASYAPGSSEPIQTWRFEYRRYLAVVLED